ncbi:MAG: DNA starvation/stationary phase protection protein [Chlamydiae bacterium]|nr:DNA starvation/stationary phase protection protein [Chlamydiota bacterium]
MNMVPKPLSTPHVYDIKGAKEISENLNTLLADTFSLHMKTKNCHWHVFGPHFRDLHIMFDEQAEQIFDMIDVLAERVRKLGHLTLLSTSQISKMQRLKNKEVPFNSSKEMLEELYQDHLEFIKYLYEAHEIADRFNDKATCSLLEVFIDEAERRLWFLYESCQNG